MHYPVLLNTTGGADNVTALFLLILSLSLVILWLWSLFHCLVNKRINSTMKIIGIFLIVSLAHLGSVIYLLLPRDSNTSETS
ncbi:MAG: hypothetical protein ACSHYF_11665 [Verrucomicrobiaceae bacterium]